MSNSKPTAKVTFADQKELAKVQESAQAANLPLAVWLRKLAVEASGLPFSPLQRGFAAMDKSQRTEAAAKGGKNRRIPLKAETLARHIWSGDFNRSGETKLVLAENGQHYLLHDFFGGTTTREGGAYRASLFEVPQERAAEIQALIEAGDKPVRDDEMEECTLGWEIIQEEILPALNELGWQHKLPWAKSF